MHLLELARFGNAKIKEIFFGYADVSDLLCERDLAPHLRVVGVVDGEIGPGPNDAVVVSERYRRRQGGLPDPTRTLDPNVDEPLQEFASKKMASMPNAFA